VCSLGLSLTGALSLSLTTQGKPPAEVDMYLARGMRLQELSDVALALAKDTPVDVPAFVTRLQTGLLKRSDLYDLGAINSFKPKGKVEGSSSSAKQPQLS
jgi:hypothetical protein